MNGFKLGITVLVALLALSCTEEEPGGAGKKPEPYVTCAWDASACGEGYHCVGGEQYVDKGKFNYKFSETDAKLLLDANGKPQLEWVLTNAAADNADAYCAKVCTSDAECPRQTRCLALDTLSDDKTGNTKRLNLCIRNEFCAPAEKVEDCFPTPGYAFVPAQGDEPAHCSISCDPSIEGICGRDRTCVDGHCEMKSGSCKVTGQYCSPCLVDDDCAPSGGICEYYGVSGTRFCTQVKPCTCEGQISNPNAEKLVIWESEDKTEQINYLANAFRCSTPECPDTPGGLKSYCRERGVWSTFRKKPTTVPVEYDWSTGYGGCYPLVKDEGMGSACFDP